MSQFLYNNSGLAFLVIVLIVTFATNFLNKSDPLFKKSSEGEEKEPINWMKIFISMVILFPITVVIIFANCSWGGCDTKSTSFFLGAELFIGAFSLIAAIVVKLRK